MEHRTGLNVTAMRSAPRSANPYVTDMGAKIFPGTPVIVNSGTNATRMMAVEKKIGRPTCRAARAMVTETGRVCPPWRLS